jgi:hypothetical protein
MQKMQPALGPAQTQVLDDVCYLINQMIYAERRLNSIHNLVFYFVFYYGDRGWTSPNAVRLTENEAAFFSNALLETFLTSYRNLLDFFERPSRRANRHEDSLAETDFGFRASLIKEVESEFDRVSKHLSHLSKLRRTRTKNESWDVSTILMNCRTTIKEFLIHCSRSYSAIPEHRQTGIANIISDLDFIGTEKHFLSYKHASTPPFWAHKSAERIHIPTPVKPAE